MNNELLDRTYIEAVYSLWGGVRFAEFLIGFVVVLIGWVWLFRHRNQLARSEFFKILGIIVVLDFLSSGLTLILAFICPLILLAGIVISSTGLSSKPSVQKIFGPRETIKNAIRILAISTLFLYTFPIFFQFVKITSAAIQGPQVFSTFLSQKVENVYDDKIQLVFDGPIEKIVFFNLLLPKKYKSVFKEGNCYQVTYFYSPIPPVIGTETYVTQIQEVSKCEPQ